MMRELRIATLMLMVFTLLTGIAYPLAITGVAQIVFHRQANGSLITADGRPAGSELIGQPFDGPRYFWSRPSATGPTACNGASSGGGNLAVTNPAQAEAVRARVANLRAAESISAEPIPVDLVTASGSGLDPHISVEAARWQIPRVARARGVAPAEIAGLVAAASAGRQWGLLGEPTVNVLRLNLALDAKFAGPGGRPTSAAAAREPR